MKVGDVVVDNEPHVIVGIDEATQRAALVPADQLHLGEQAEVRSGHLHRLTLVASRADDPGAQKPPGPQKAEEKPEEKKAPSSKKA